MEKQEQVIFVCLFLCKVYSRCHKRQEVKSGCKDGFRGYEVIPNSSENMRLLKRSSGSWGIFSGKISQMKVMSL